MVYLDNAATSWPKPNTVYKEMINCMKEYGANPGRSGHRMAIEAGEKIYECRENISNLFGISNPLNVSFTNNTTEALNLGIKGLLKPCDHVITTSMEHNSVIRPLKKLEVSGVKVTVVNADDKGRLNPDVLSKYVKPETKLIVTTHASNISGTIIPIKQIGEIAKNNNIIYMVDAAQTAGLYPIDVDEMHIDMLAFPGHKGLLGPQGTGGLYVREDIVLDSLIEGGTGSVSESPYQPEFAPDKYESGTLNTPGIAGLNEGIKYIMESGIDAIRAHEQVLAKYMLEGLSSISKVCIAGDLNLKNRVGVISFNIKDKDCVDVCTVLDEQYKIAARGGLHCAYLAHQTLGTLSTGTIRFSIGYFNTKKDVAIALKAINELAR